MVETIHVDVRDRWDAVALLNAFADRGSYLVNHGDHFDLRVVCDPCELDDRLALLPPTPTMTCVVVRASSGPHSVALAGSGGRH